MDASRLKERRWVFGIILLYALFALGYSLLMPLWEVPDEPAHYHLVWRLARFGPFPTLKQNYEADQPRAFYYLASLVIRGLDKINPHLSDYYLPYEHTQNMFIPVPRFDWSQANYRFLLGIHMLRWLDILFGAGALWLAWKSFLLIAPGLPALRLAALALAALTPQFLHIMSSVSNDPLGTLAGALLFYLAVLLTTTDSRYLRWISVPLAVILPLTTKLTVLPVSLALLLVVIWQSIHLRLQKRQLLYLGVGLLGVMVLLYILAPSVLHIAAYEIQWRLLSFRPDAFSPKYDIYISRQILWTYWGELGWLAIRLPPALLVTLSALGFIGMIINGYHLIKAKTSYPQFRAWLVTWLTALLTVAAVLKNGLTTSASQGRFLFPAIGALSLLMVSGWHAILPQQYRRLLPLMVTILMLICTLVLWQFGVLPVYYQPYMD